MMTSPCMTLQLSSSAKSASQYGDTAELNMVVCRICEGPHYTRDCPPGNWDTVDWMTDEGTPAPMSDADLEYHSSSSIPDGRNAQSPEPDSQGSNGDCGASCPNGGWYAYDLDSGSTEILSIVSQPSKPSDPSVQAESEPDRSEAAATESPPPPYHEQDDFQSYHAHDKDMVWSPGSPQTALEDLKEEDFSAMVPGDY